MVGCAGLGGGGAGVSDGFLIASKTGSSNQMA